MQHVSCAEERSNRTKGVYSVDHTGDKDDIAEFKAKLELCVGSKLPNEVIILFLLLLSCFNFFLMIIFS